VLQVGCDLTKMTADTIRILTSPGALAVDQDELGVQGTVCWESQGVFKKALQVWRKPLSDGTIAIVALNRGGPAGATIDVALTKCGHGSSSEAEGAVTTVTDVWTGTVLANVSGGGNYTTVPLAKHGHAFLKLQAAAVSPQRQQALPRCIQSNSATERMALACPTGTHITALSTWWGARTSLSADTCTQLDGANIVGGSFDRTALISDGCLGKQSCTFAASERVFGATSAAEPRFAARFVCE
jgi:alpha-galactosidase